MAVLAQVERAASHITVNRPGTIAGIAIALLLATAWHSAYAASLGTASIVHAAVQSAATVRRARPARPLDLSEPRTAIALPHASGLRPEASRALAAVLTRDDARGSDFPAGAKSVGSISLHWRSGPEIVRVARQFRHNGLPIVRLWQSGQNLVAIGLNPHGVPGIYFTQQVKD
jgi:hypothetical protein